MSVVDRLEALFRDFHFETGAFRENEIDFEEWAQRAFEAVMGEEPTHDEEDQSWLSDQSWFSD